MFILAAEIMTRGHSADPPDRDGDEVHWPPAGRIGDQHGDRVHPVWGRFRLDAATVVAVGSPLRPKMLEAGYRDSFVLALIINASDIAFLIPPSIGMIIYGVVSNTSIAELFIAGVGPGLMILGMFALYSYIYACINRVPTEQRPVDPNAGGLCARRSGRWAFRSSS